jgi:integrase
VISKPRRPRGSGGVRNRGTERNPRWFAIHWVTVDGKRCQVTKGPFRRKVDAERWLQDELHLTREGRPTLPSRITVAELLNEWLAVRKPGLEPSTYAEYKRYVERRLTPHIGDHKVKDLRPGHVARMFEALRQPGANQRGKHKRGLSETSLQHTHVALSSALDYAVRQRIIAHNVMVDVDRPRRQRTAMRVWSAGQLAKFLTAVEADRLHPVLRLASHTGARRSELLGLKWPQLDLAAATLSITARRTRVGYEMIERAGTKTAAGARVIDLDPLTVELLRAWRKAQATERQAWGVAYVDTDYVFTAENGEPLHADHLSQRFERLVATAGVPTIRFHDLRHTHATLLLKAGVPPHVVAQRLGHASPALTLSIYSHVLPRQQAAAAAAFSKLVDDIPTCDDCGEALDNDGPLCDRCGGTE